MTSKNSLLRTSMDNLRKKFGEVLILLLYILPNELYHLLGNMEDAISIVDHGMYAGRGLGLQGARG